VSSPTSTQSTQRQTRDDAGKAYWWRVPDDQELLMSLRPAELKSYLVVIGDPTGQERRGA